jgi:hypothetical protein
MNIDQCLFGYADGHRLLASSMRLSGDAVSELSHLSDIAPGAIFGSSDSYWSGLPMPKLGRFVLMRTWPAPEMSRPGCVWTHSLLLDTAIFEELQDLSALRQLTRRPDGLSGHSPYTQPLELSSAAGNSSTISRTERIEELLLALYEGSTGLVLVNAPGEVDDAVFAVWSQQWPRLRRNFRFQTAARRSGQASQGVRFDIKVQLYDGHGAELGGLSKHGRGWVEVAADDIRGSGDGLRRFLWRYGKDVKHQRRSFRPLCQLYLIDAGLAASDHPVKSVDIVAESFADAGDAASLKKDIVEGELLGAAQLDALDHMITENGQQLFPMPSRDSVSRLAQLWPTQSERLLDLAERALSLDGELAIAVQDVVLGAIPKTTFWSITADFPNVRRRLVQSHPDLLDTDELGRLSTTALRELLGVIPDGTALTPSLARRLLQFDDQSLASMALGMNSPVISREVIGGLDHGGSGMARCWIRALAGRPDLLLTVETMRHVKRTSTLYRLADALGWAQSEVLQAGPDPWISGLVDVETDISGDERLMLITFLIVIALCSRNDGSRQILEMFFAVLHDRIMRSYLPWRARDMLTPFLPDLGWSNWDLARRLRLAVAGCYIGNQFDPKSYAALSDNKQGRKLLKEAAKEITGGRLYAAAL